jgi:hypothetical protein
VFYVNISLLLFRDSSYRHNRLAQVALVVAGDEGVSGGSGGRLSGQSGQRSRKVYTPPARIFRRLARPDVVSSVAQVCVCPAAIEFATWDRV